MRFTLSEQLKIAKRTYIYISNLVEILQECRPHRDIPHTQQLPCWNEQGRREVHFVQNVWFRDVWADEIGNTILQSEWLNSGV